MAEKEKLGKNVAEQLKQALEGLGVGFLGLCDVLGSVIKENEDLTRRLGEAELLLGDLSSRVDNADLRAGVAVTSRIAEGTLTSIPQMEPLEVT